MTSLCNCAAVESWKQEKETVVVIKRILRRKKVGDIKKLFGYLGCDLDINITF